MNKIIEKISEHGKSVVHCKTIEERNVLLDYLISIGATWISGKEIEKSNDKEDINHWDIWR